MKIAILGWGSLVWNPGELKISSQKWKVDGPYLPIEFARKSSGGRLTLVLYKNASAVRTLWTLAESEDLAEAICNLARREDTTTKKIGYVSIPDNKDYCNTVKEILPKIKSWANQKNLDAVIWTDLPPKGFKELTPVSVANFIKTRNASEFRNAEIYVRNAPEQVKTKMRDFLEKEFGWTYKSQKERDWSDLKKKLEKRRIDKSSEKDSYWVVVPEEPATFGHLLVISWKGYEDQDITDKGLFRDNKHMQKIMRIVHDLAFEMKSCLTSNGKPNGKKCEKVYLVSECETEDFPFHFHLIPRFRGEKIGHMLLFMKELEEARWLSEDDPHTKVQDGWERWAKIEAISNYHKSLLLTGKWVKSDEEQNEFIGKIITWWKERRMPCEQDEK